MQDDADSSQRKAVGVYDRPASADRPKARTHTLVAVIVVLLLGVAIYVLLTP